MNTIYEVKCPKNINKNSLIEVVVPGSKSITNRALLLAAMANGTSTLKGCLTSDDARHFIECLKTLGFPVTETSDGQLGSDITITGFGGNIPNKKAEIYVGSAGTAARFLAAMLAFSDGEYIITSSEQMKKRPMGPLIAALRDAGSAVKCLEEEGHFPLHIIGAKKQTSTAHSFTVNIDKSSQFLSALLIAIGTLHMPAEINVVGSHGLSYVDLTVEMMKDFGVIATKQVIDKQIKYVFNGEGIYHALDYNIEPDMSAAAYFYALAAVLDARLTVKGVTNHMLQGDTAFLEVLEKMGCELIGLNHHGHPRLDTQNFENVIIKGPNAAQLTGGFSIDMSSFSDQALTLAAIAPFADTPITITGIGHIRLQECDRIHAIVSNLTALGIKVDEKENEVTIYPGMPKACDIETFDDHRVAMSFALTGLKTKGVRILNPDCCKKTFAQYFEVLDKILTALSLD